MKDPNKITKLLQEVSRTYIISLAHQAMRKGYYGKDKVKVRNEAKNNENQPEFIDSPLWKVTKWSHLTFHTVSLVERPNNNISNHWGLHSVP